MTRKQMVRQMKAEARKQNYEKALEIKRKIIRFDMTMLNRKQLAQ